MARNTHNHEHKRTVVECSVVCSNEDIMQRYNEYPAVVCLLLKNLQKVDEWVCLEPVEEGAADRISEAGKIPYNHTDLGNWCVYSGNAGSLEKRKPKKGKGGQAQQDIDEDDLVFP